MTRGPGDFRTSDRSPLFNLTSAEEERIRWHRARRFRTVVFMTLPMVPAALLAAAVLWRLV